MKINRILVPIKGSGFDEDIIRLVCEMVRRTKAQVFVINVIEVKRTLPLDADMPSDLNRGEDILERAEVVARESRVDIETELLQARDVGPAIVDEAVERNVDTIIMGIPYRKRFGEFDTGRTVSYVLKNAPCQVWLLRQAIGPSAD